MTLRGKFEKLLYERGLSEKEAAGVLELYETSRLGEEMKGRLDDDESGYSPQLVGIVWAGICMCAVKWIDANKPKHWARSMFVE
jgi:hypothetical protein